MKTVPVGSRVNMFGALDIRIGDRIVTPSAPKQAQLLSLLLLRAGERVARDTIAEELWALNPPTTYRAAIHTYIMQLRRALGETQPVPLPIVHDASRYTLLSHEAVGDFTAYTNARRLAHNCVTSGDVQGLIRSGRQALRLWTGDLLADVRHGPVITQDVRTLERGREVLRRDLADALIRQNDLAEGLALLESSGHVDVAVEDPSPLRFYCLARLGRRAEALRLYTEMHPRIASTPSLRWLRAAHIDLVGAAGVLRAYDYYVPTPN